MTQRRQVIITGVAGFIGSNLGRQLLEKGFDVIGIDDLSHGLIRNIREYRSHPRFRFVQADITRQGTMESLQVMDGYVVHLAAYKIPRYGNILDTLVTNHKGTENVLEFARRTNCAVVFASTSDVYGKGPAVPFREADDLVLGSPQSSRWAYAVSKMHDEHLCFAYAERYRVRSTIIRYFGGYGPNQHPSWWGGPQSVFMEAVLAGKPLEIHGDGLQTRSFTYVDDLVKGTILAMESDNAWGEIFNIGDTREISIVELAEMIWRLMKKEGKPPMTFVPYTTFHGGRYEDVRRRIPDITKARDMLGFVPTVKLEDGLKTTIEWRMQIAREKIAGDPSGEHELLR